MKESSCRTGCISDPRLSWSQSDVSVLDKSFLKFLDLLKSIPVPDEITELIERRRMTALVTMTLVITAFVMMMMANTKSFYNVIFTIESNKVFN